MAQMLRFDEMRGGARSTLVVAATIAATAAATVAGPAAAQSGAEGGVETGGTSGQAERFVLPTGREEAVGSYTPPIEEALRQAQEDERTLDDVFIGLEVEALQRRQDATEAELDVLRAQLEQMAAILIAEGIAVPVER